MTQAPPHHDTRMTWPHFNEEQSIRVFSCLFEELATAYNFPAALWKSMYCCLLKGISLELASLHSRFHPACSYESFRDYLTNKLDPQHFWSAQLRFEARVRGKRETLQEFVAELRSAAYDAYSDMHCGPVMLDVLVLQTFHRNLRGALGEKVRERFCTTLEEAVVLARNLETIGVTEAEHSTTAAAVNRRPKNRANAVRAFGGNRGGGSGRGGAA